VIDGIVPQVRLRAVRGNAAGVAPPADGPFVRDDDVELRRLGDDAAVRDAGKKF
jgi:hypothetical protein